MDPLHIDDNANDSNDSHDNTNDFDDINDTIRMIPARWAGVPNDCDNDVNDYDNDDDHDNDETKDGNDTDYEDNDTGNNDIDNHHDTDYDNDTENDGYDSEYDAHDPENDDDDSLRTDDDDSPLRTDDDETQDLDPRVDQKHLISNDKTIMNRMLMPLFTFTPPSPQIGGDAPQPLRFGHTDDFANHVTRSPYLRVPEVPRGSSSTDSPPFFRLAPASQQPGNSEEQFAKRMFTKCNSLRSRRRAAHMGFEGVAFNDGTGIRPTKMRRIVEEN